MARLLGTGVVVALSYLLLCNEVHMSGPMARLLGTGVVVALSYLLLCNEVHMSDQWHDY